ncbi:hypothetical protein ACIA03_00165 [Nocardioides sp. NPDC051685]|uniref:hypothetical protein n=1 Tax=Nocardioides sp. NPDC051685 TaxID=3364334 RepID=UPI0037A2F509
MDLEVAIEHVTYAEMAAAFEKVTGHPAQYVDIDLETYWNSPDLKGIADHPAGYNADTDDKSTMSFRDNFTGFWNVWKHGIITRTYALLDEIHPPIGSGAPRSGSFGRTSWGVSSAREASGRGCSRKTG